MLGRHLRSSTRHPCSLRMSSSSPALPQAEPPAPSPSPFLPLSPAAARNTELAFASMSSAWIRHMLTTVGTMASRPAAFLVVPAYGVLWYLSAWKVRLGRGRHSVRMADDAFYPACRA